MRQLLGAISTLLAISYPLWVWLMLTYQRGVPWFAGVLLLIGGLRLLLSLSMPSQSRFLPMWWSVAVNVVMMALGAWVLLRGEGTAFQVYPLLISGGLLVVFASSLLSKQPMIERFVAVYEKNITPEKQAYMRRVTQLWCGFFVLNFMLSAYTWLAMSLEAWTWYNGVISYLLIGLVFIAEYAYRRLVFLKKYE